VWGFEIEGFGRPDVDKVCCGMKSFSPVIRGHGCLEKDGSKNIVGGANRTLCFAVLGRGIRAGEAKNGSKGGEKTTVRMIVELFAVVTLDCTDGG
jgi:hypothetical protein